VCASSGTVQLSPDQYLFIAIGGVVLCALLYWSYTALYKEEEEEEVEEEEEEERASAPMDFHWMQSYLKHSFSGILIKLKIVITTYQVVSTIPSITQVSFPSSFTGFLDGISVVNLNLGGSVPVGCSQPYNFIDELVLTTLFPIALTAVIFVLYLLEHFGTSALLRRRHAAIRLLRHRHIFAATMESKLEKVFNKYLNYFFYLTYLVLPSVTTSIFQIFVCSDVDPNRY
jgi:hypothetical protein